MCSVDTDINEEFIPIENEVQLGLDVACRKCKEKPAEVILRKIDPYCRDCFLSYVTHKFRSCLGKHKQVPADAKILIGTSGGLSSSALLHLTHCGVALGTLKKLRVQPAFLYVDDRCIENNSTHCNKDDSSFDADALTALEAVSNLGYSCYYTTMETAMQPHTSSPPVPYIQGESAIANLRQESCQASSYKQLQQFIDGACGQTSVEVVRKQLLLNCLTQSCVMLGYTRLFLGDNATTVANNILSGVAEGSGAHVSQHVSFYHKDKHTGVEIFRPVREVLEDELKHYLRLNVVPYSNKEYTKNTIRGCTYHFLTGLQEGFPSTIPTVFRTGDKLVAFGQPSATSTHNQPKRSKNSHSKNSSNLKPAGYINGNFDANKDILELCALCHYVLDTNQPQASALEAKNISRKFSRDPVNCNVESLLNNESASTTNNAEYSANEKDQTVLEKVDKRSNVKVTEKVNVVKTDNSTSPIDGNVFSDNLNTQSGLESDDKHSNTEVKENVDVTSTDDSAGTDDQKIFEDKKISKYLKLVTRQDLDALLCYACRITLQQMSDFSALPLGLRLQVCSIAEKRLQSAGIDQFILS